MINSYLLIFCVSLFFFLSISILFKRLGVVDKPDGIRKLHKGEIPLSGGFSLFLVFLFSTFYLYPGYFGNAILRRFLSTDIKEIRVFSRDELKQDNISKKILRIIVSYIDYVNRTVWHKG